MSKKSSSSRGKSGASARKRDGARDTRPQSEKKSARPASAAAARNWPRILLIAALALLPVAGFGLGVWFYHSKPPAVFGYDPGAKTKKAEAPLLYQSWQRGKRFKKHFTTREEAQDKYHSEIRDNAGSFVQNPSNPLSGAVYFADLPSEVTDAGVWSNDQSLGTVRYDNGVVYFNWLYVGANNLMFRFMDAGGDVVEERGFEIEVNLDEKIQELMDDDFITKAVQLAPPTGRSDRPEELLSFIVQGGGVSWFAAYDAYGRLRMALYAVGGGSPVHTYRDGVLYSYVISAADHLYSYDFETHRYSAAGRLSGYAHHHALELGPREGTMLTLADKYSEGNLTFNYLLEYELGSGRVLRELDFRDILDENRLPIEDTWQPITARWIHPNSLFYDEGSDQMIVSSRGQSAVLGIDYGDFSLSWLVSDERDGEIDPDQKARTKDLEDYTLAWNSDLKKKLLSLPEEVGPMSGQHGAKILSNGQMAVFDNRALVDQEETKYVAPTEVRSRLLLMDVDAEGVPMVETATAYDPLALFSKIKGGVDLSDDGRLTIGYGGICKSELGLLTLSIWSFCPNQRAFMAEFILPNLEDPSLALSVDGQSYSPLYISSGW
ncbi:MAG: aryl-sulfate sulfotransferase [Alphaproteobacteria bacterium]|nr:aryl-sulfate sulfotransferase [Alphaproteobacteria bacterium]MDA8004856.1 aryl-sulfate sulfotransferase [Alphaproteobacteria bacterium]MDA8006279.1 aryl-sulfate sulfotransferase [Alphaproteobacteria bacterium]MDA8013958.1 aryl-sulfate sulfotransferase [Alphaproteobacteria bacterium]